MIGHLFFSGCLYGLLFCAVNAPLHTKASPDYLLPLACVEVVAIGNQLVSGHRFEWEDIGADTLGAGASLLTLKVSF